MTASEKKPKRKIPISLKQTRKELPPPGRSFKDKTKYNRKKAKRELKRTLPEASRLK